MRKLTTAAFATFILFGLSFGALAAGYKTYGSTGTYTVALNENNACIAIRSIDHELPSGRIEQAMFGIGFSYIDGGLYAIASIQSNTYEMPEMSWQSGNIFIDGNSYDVLFMADSSNQLTAMGPISMFNAMLEGYELTFDLPRMTETMPLTGTHATQYLLGRCAEDLVNRIEGSGGSINPLSPNQSRRQGNVNPLR